MFAGTQKTNSLHIIPDEPTPKQSAILTFPVAPVDVLLTLPPLADPFLLWLPADNIIAVALKVSR